MDDLAINTLESLWDGGSDQQDSEDASESKYNNHEVAPTQQQPCYSYQQASKPFASIMPYGHLKHQRVRSLSAAAAAATADRSLPVNKNAPDNTASPMLRSSEQLRYNSGSGQLRLPPVGRVSRDSTIAAAAHIGTTAGGVGSSTTIKPAVWSAAPDSSSLFELQQEVASCKMVFVSAQLQAQTCAKLVASMEQDVRSLQAEEQQLLMKQPAAPQRLAQVKEWLQERQVALEQQRRLLDEKQLVLLKVESELRAAETVADLAAAAAAASDAGSNDGQTTGSAHNAAAHDAAAAMRRREVASGRGCMDWITAAAAQQAAEQGQQRVRGELSVQAAMAAQAAAKRRLRDAQGKAAANALAATTDLRPEEERRRSALLSLKGNSDGVKHSVAAKADVFRQLQAQKRDLESREFEALLEAGANPYAVFRQRDIEAAQRKEAAALSAAQQVRRAELAATLEAEERQRRRNKQKEDLDRQVEERYQREMGTAAQLARTDAYMRSHTVTHQALVDPTSRCPQYPSEVVRVVPNSFGLGGADPQVLAMVADKLGGSGAVDLSSTPLLPSTYRAALIQAAGSTSTLQGGSKRRGSDLQVEQEAEGEGEGDEQAEGPSDDELSAGGSSDGREGGSADGRASPSSGGGSNGSREWKGLTMRKLSKFEADRMAAAKARHKERVTYEHERQLRQTEQQQQKQQQQEQQQQLQAGGTAASKSPIRGATSVADTRGGGGLDKDEAGISSPGGGGAVPSFVAAPAEVVFDDIMPGVTRRAEVTLINRGRSKGSIRLMDIPGEMVDVLEATLPPPGFLAPGAGCTLSITLTPKVEVDMSGFIQLLTPSGPMWLPLRCLARRALPTLSPEGVVEVGARGGGVMVAAKADRIVTITNSGALHVMYDIKVEGPLAETAEVVDPESGPGFGAAMGAPAQSAATGSQGPAEADGQYGSTRVPPAAGSVSVAGFTVTGTRGVVPGYGQTTFTVEFAPLVPGYVEVPLVVRFSAPANKSLAVRSAHLVVAGTGRELPVSAEKEVIDFKCVTPGRRYAAALVLRNAGATAMKVQIQLGPPTSRLRELLLSYLSFAPDFGYAQAGGSLLISVGLTPRPDMVAKLARFLVGPEQEGVLQIPVAINVPGQPLPVNVTLKAQLTTSDLLLYPSSLLDLGRVPLGEAAGAELAIFNPGRLPQSFSLGADRPAGLTVSPNNGYGTVLPHETVKLLVSYRPPITGPQYFSLRCCTLAGRIFTAEGKCEGFKPPVALSHNIVKFPATAMDDSSSISLVIANRTPDQHYAFEFGVPESSWLQVTPRVGTLAPGQSMRLQLEYSPPATLVLQQGADTAGRGMKQQGVQAAAGQPGGKQMAVPQPGQQQVPQGQKVAQPAHEAPTGPPPPAATAAPSLLPTAAAKSATAAAVVAGGSSGVSGTVEREGSGADVAASGGAADQQRHKGASESEAGKWHQWREWVLPCYLRPLAQGGGTELLQTVTGQQQDAAAGLSQSSVDAVLMPGSCSTGREGSSGGYVLHLCATVCAVAPELLLDPPGLPRPAGKNYYSLDFGALAVGERTLRTVTLRNTGSDPAPLSAAPLDPAGPFIIVNALRPVAPDGGTLKLLLAFSPSDCGPLRELVTLRSAKSRLRLELKGQGVAPRLDVRPPAALQTGLEFGDVLVGDVRESKVTLVNTSPFPVSFGTRFVGPGAAPMGRQAGSSMMIAGGGIIFAAPPAAPGKPAGAAATGGAAGAATKAVAAPSGVQQQVAASSAASAPAAAGSPSAERSRAKVFKEHSSGCFFCRPAGATLAPGETREVTVVFLPGGAAGAAAAAAAVGLGKGRGGAAVVGGSGSAPAAAGAVTPLMAPLNPYIEDTLEFVVAHQAEPLLVPLAGRAWGEGAFVAGAAYPLAAVDPFAAAASAAAAAAASIAIAAAGPQAPAQQGAAQKGATPAAAAAAAAATLVPRPPKQLALQLPGPVAVGQASSALMEVGSIKSSSGTGAPVEVLLEDMPAALKAAGWSIVEPLKQVVPLGEKRTVSVKFTPPAASASGGNSVGALLGLPETAECSLHISLKGGLPAAGTMECAAGGADGEPRRVDVRCSCVMAPPAATVAPATAL